MDFEDKMRLINKAKQILNPAEPSNLRVKPWSPDKITRARNWFGSSDRVQQIISNHYHIKK
jgi:hypothetical protein